MNQVIAAYILTHFDTISFDIFDTLIERSVSKLHYVLSLPAFDSTA